MSFFDRFQPPKASDERASCVNCDETFHYTELDGHGLCQDCQPDIEEKDDEDVG